MTKTTVSPTGIEQDEWAALEAQRAAELNERGKWDINHRVQPKFRDAPHPESAWAHVPLRGQQLNGRNPSVRISHGKNARAKTTEKAIPSPISVNAAHRDSYRPDIPLHGYSYAVLIKPSKEDRAQWAARPLRYGSRHDPEPVASPTVEKVLAGVSVAPIVPDRVATSPRVGKRVPKSTSERMPQSHRDSLRRGYIAFLKGRVQVEAASGRYMVTIARGSAVRLATWDDVVRAKHPSLADLQHAAQCWQSPRNQRTLSTH